MGRASNRSREEGRVLEVSAGQVHAGRGGVRQARLRPCQVATLQLPVGRLGRRTADRNRHSPGQSGSYENPNTRKSAFEPIASGSCRSLLWREQPHAEHDDPRALGDRHVAA